MRKPRANCPSCGRPDAPIKVNGAFHCHTRQGSSPRRYEYCYGPKNYNYYMGGLGYEPFDNAILYARDRKAQEMATYDYYESRIALAKERHKQKEMEEIARLEQLRDLALLKELEREEMRARFGTNEDYEEGSIIYYKYRYNGGGIAYTFVAVKAGREGGWYTTNKADRNWYTFDELVENYLSKAVEVYYVTKMEEL